MEDAYTKITNLILGMPDLGILNIPNNENREITINFLKSLIDEKFFHEYGFDIVFLNNMSCIKKYAMLNERLLKRYPQVNTYGKLLFLIKNPDLYKIYDNDNRLKYRRDYEGENLSES